MKPVIGIVSRSIPHESEAWRPPRQGFYETYVEALIAAGAIPLIIPQLQKIDVLAELYQRTDGMLFAGGGDVHPRYYGQDSQPTLEKVNARQDDLELRLINAAAGDHKPLLGICRGMQLINIAHGGTLHKNLETDLNHDTSRRQFAHLAHNISINPASRLAGIIQKDKIDVNSLHHQGISELGSGLKAVAWAPDGVIEAIEADNDQYLLGVQFHPESLTDPVWESFFADFTQAALVKTSSRV